MENGLVIIGFLLALDVLQVQKVSLVEEFVFFILIIQISGGQVGENVSLIIHLPVVLERFNGQPFLMVHGFTHF